MSDIDTILKERRAQHGDFSDNARFAQKLKLFVRENVDQEKLSFVQTEALEMILHKIARIMSGDANHKDHWDDIAGYARLVSERLP
jgi:hypothetical protein